MPIIQTEPLISQQGSPPLLVTEDGPLQPGVEGPDPGVDPRHPRPPAPDAEADDPDLEPLAGLLAYQGSPAISVTGVTTLGPGTHRAGRQAVPGTELLLQGRGAHRLLPQRHLDLLQDHAVLTA